MYTESPPLWHASSDRPRRPTSQSYRASSGFKSAQTVPARPSATRATFRAFTRFSVAVLIGVAATLAWQSYGSEMVRARAPSLGWLLPAPPSGPAVTSAELQAQLKPATLDLAILRRNVEQLTTNQDQLARKEDQLTQAIAVVQSAEQDISQKILAIAPAAPKVVHVPTSKSLQ
jgi:hypothetical protein